LQPTAKPCTNKLDRRVGADLPTATQADFCRQSFTAQLRGQRHARPQKRRAQIRKLTSIGITFCLHIVLLLIIIITITIIEVGRFQIYQLFSCFFYDISFYKLFKDLIFLFIIVIIVLNEQK